MTSKAHGVRVFSFLLAITVSAVLALSSCSPGSLAETRPTRQNVVLGSIQPQRLSYVNALHSAARPSKAAKSPLTVLVQATSGATPAADSTSSASPVNTAVESEDPTVVECLKCHGPFAKLAEKTEGYVTEWDETANPHLYVPHDSTTIVTCTECHEAHPLPVSSTTTFKKANVQYCYSCHHAETLVACNQCHNE